ncbi:MAG: hypothetical protein EOL86_09145 [Deltaproteobacteria bacterium]|nr:hypothetical protein [Deltaproteobacteria bacterium]
MGKGTARIDKPRCSAALAKIAAGSTCPLTNGRPLKISRSAFEAACRDRREKGLRWGYNKRAAENRTAYNRCETCQGKRIPKEVRFYSEAELKRLSSPTARQPKSAGGTVAGLSLVQLREPIEAPKTNNQPCIEERTMARTGICESCKSNRASGKNYDMLMCSGCSTIHSNVRNKTAIVAEAIKRTGKTGEILECLGVPAVAAVQVESEMLEKIADLLGYDQGQETIDGEELLATLAARLTPTPEIDDDQLRELISAQTALDEICRAVGLENGDELTYKMIVLAVAQTAAGLEAAERSGAVAVADGDLLTQADILVRIGKAVDHAGPAADLPGEIEILVGDLADLKERSKDHASWLDKVATLVDAATFAPDDILAAVAQSEAVIEDLMLLTGGLASTPSGLAMLFRLRGDELHRLGIDLQGKQEQIGLLADQLSEAEQKLLADEQIFARIREVIEGDGIAPGDLPTAISAKLFAGYPLPSPRAGHGERLDARLLGLLLDHPEIWLERIAEIREAV